MSSVNELSDIMTAEELRIMNLCRDPTKLWCCQKTGVGAKQAWGKGYDCLSAERVHQAHHKQKKKSRDQGKGTTRQRVPVNVPQGHQKAPFVVPIESPDLLRSRPSLSDKQSPEPGNAFHCPMKSPADISTRIIASRQAPGSRND